MSASTSGLVARLRPEVAEFATHCFELRNDLERMLDVHRAGADEAVVFYSSRILEALAADAMRRLAQTPSVNVYSNLAALENWNRFGVATRSWAHALRRLGNTVRHLGSRVGQVEAQLAMVFAEGWLDWFFCDFSHGCRLIDGCTHDRQPLKLVDGTELYGWMRSLERLESEAIEDVHSGPLKTPVASAVVAEILLSRDHGAALEVLQMALSHFPDDLRLNQLLGVYWSRKDEWEKALACLEPIYKLKPDDEETAGIVAGVYKRRWFVNPTNRSDLEFSHRTYRSAWKRSGGANTYLGINVAATALWLGERSMAAKVAFEVESVLRRSLETLPPEIRDADTSYQFWDRVKLAEAELIQGNIEQAQELYRAAFERQPDRTGDIAVCKRQAERIIAALDKST